MPAAASKKRDGYSQVKGTRVLESHRRHELEPSIEALLPAVYDELRRLAATQIARRAHDATLQPTALVHEAWLRLTRSESADWESRAHFIAAAAEAMRHILIDRARRRRALRHGGGNHHVNVDEVDLAATSEEDDQLLAVSTAIDKLEGEHPQIAELVKLRYFVGLEVKEAALALNVSRATANRWWTFARTWIYSELRSS
ncbi:ECF-type sigma factor [Steroidobacter agaridevorans]|uniref:ECF-type sigma factor n=1 Tax=Steroidobacter agaridevorans TaxID=2695856 RepID=UPI0013793B3A|nr:ECF-type sigma factor [Steroidobacter agaridevorans]